MKELEFNKYLKDLKDNNLLHISKGSIKEVYRIVNSDNVIYERTRKNNKTN